MIYPLITALLYFVACHEFGMWATVTGGSIFSAMAVIALYFSGKLYCLEWRRILEKSGDSTSLPLAFYESVFLPGALIVLIAGIEIANVTERGTLMMVAVGLFLLSADFLGLIRRYLLSVYHGPSELEARKLFLRYPPVDRIDLLPFDALFNLVLLWLLWKRFH